MLEQNPPLQSGKVPLDFSQLFRDYINSSVNAALERIDPDPNVALADQERDRVLHVLSFSLKVPHAWKATYDLLQVMTPKMERVGQWQDWLAVLHKSVEVSRSAQDSPALANLTLQLGYLCTLMGDYGSAAEWLTQARELSHKIDNPSLQSLILIRLANLARLQSHYIQAKEYLAEVLPLVDDDNDRRARYFSVLGAIARDTQDHQLAEHYSRQALDLQRRGRDQRMMAVCLNDLGESLRLQKAYDDAIQCYEEALAIYAHAHDVVKTAMTMMNLGIVHSLSNRPQKALETYAKAEKVFRDVYDRTHLAMIYNNQGIEFLNLERWDEAERAYQKSFSLWSMLDKPDAMINVLDGLGLAKMGKGAFEEAIEIFESAKNLLGRIEDNALVIFYEGELTPHIEQARKNLTKQREKTQL